MQFLVVFAVFCVFSICFKYREFLQFLILNDILQLRVMVFLAMFEVNLKKHGICFKL